MRILKGLPEQVAIWVAILLFVSGPLMAFAIADTPARSRADPGNLTKIPEARGLLIKGVDWRPGTDQAFLVGQGVIYLYNATTKNLTQLDGTESVDNYYEAIAWRPKGDYAIIVGATPISSRASGLIALLQPQGLGWKITLLQTTPVRLSGIAWTPDSTYAVIVGGAMSGDTADIPAVMLRFSGSSLTFTQILSDTGPGLSDVSYNPALQKFYACGLHGRMVTYDGTNAKDITDPALKDINLFAITWRDNGGRGMMGGWYMTALVGYIVTTDGTYNRIINDPNMGLVTDADWAPKTDYTLFVGQNGGLWEYMESDKLPTKIASIDSKHYYGVGFNDAGTTAIIVGIGGEILRYDVTYPPQKNFPPEAYIVSPHDKDSFDYGSKITFSSNSTHDDDLDPMNYAWSSSIEGSLSNQAYFTRNLTAGTHLITLTVTDTDSHKSNAYINITIRPPTDVPSIDAGPYKIGYVGKDVDLTGRVVKTGYPIKSYEWDCTGTGQFKTTNGPSTQCNYAKVAKYNATFRVTDVRLAVATRKAIVTIFPPLSDANTTLLNMTSKGTLHKGEYLLFSVNSSVSSNIEIYVVPPKGADVVTPPAPAIKGVYNVSFQVPGSFAAGQYRVKWRYLDQNGTRTEWYVTKPAFDVKKYNEDGTVNLIAMIVAVIVVIVLVVVATVVIVMYMLKRAVTKLEAAILFYQDGRVMHSYSPPAPESKTPPPPQQPAAPPQAPPPAAPVQPAYAPQQQYAAPTGAPPMEQVPQYPAQPAQQYPQQPVPQAPQQTTPAPMSTGVAHLNGVVNEAINAIRQGTAHKLPDKLLEGGRTIYIEQGQHTILAVSITGPDIATMRKNMKNALQEIEIVYGNQLRNWDGLVIDMPRLQAIIEKEVKVRE